jgi:hypothetical protein
MDYKKMNEYRIVRIPNPDPDVYDQFAVVGPGGYRADGFTTHATALLHALEMANNALDSSRIRETRKELPSHRKATRRKTVIAWDSQAKKWICHSAWMVVTYPQQFTHWVPAPKDPS